MKQRESDPYLGELYLAGERVPPGIYKEIESGRRIRHDGEDFLPASLDWRVACYAAWGRIPVSAGEERRQA